MASCSICLENNTDIQLGCLHRFHNECINQWRTINNSCPNCRINIIFIDIRKVMLNLSDDDYSSFTSTNYQFQTINIAKGTNPQIRSQEINFIEKFTEKSFINTINCNNINNNIIAYIPKTSGNNIYLGNANIENNYIIFNNSYVINRQSGHVYKTYPLLRKYKLSNNDLFYIFN